MADREVILDLAWLRWNLSPDAAPRTRNPAHFLVSLPTLQEKKPFTLTESFVLPAADAAARQRLRTFIGYEVGAPDHRAGDDVVRALTGRLENGQPVLYGVSYTSLYKFVDASAYTAAVAITQTIPVDNAPGGAFAFRGISFSPGTREAIALGTATAQLAREITLWPNPATAEVQLDLPASLAREAVRVSVLNALGQTVAAHTLAAGAARVLPLAGLAAGVYTVRLKTSAGTVSKRLLRE